MVLTAAVLRFLICQIINNCPVLGCPVTQVLGVLGPVTGAPMPPATGAAFGVLLLLAAGWRWCLMQDTCSLLTSAAYWTCCAAGVVLDC